MPQVKPSIETFAKIKVVGVGGGGGSAVDRMVKSGIRGVEFMAMNTDVQALQNNSAPYKLHLGKTITRGLGSGMDPEIGKRSAEEAQNEIREALKDSDMVFITCGLGGGTGSGASPVIAAIARELGALTIAVVTKPFSFEGAGRKAIAEKAHEELARNVDTIITIPNDRALQIIDKKTSLLEAFKIIDDVLHQGVQGISELITVPGLINVDFADVRTIMRDTGSALMGIGRGKGDDRAVEAAKAAISSPLLDVSIDGARGILFTITGGVTLGMHEVAEAAKIITGSADEDARVIFGAVIDESLGEELRITVIATGFEDRGHHLLHSDIDATGALMRSDGLSARADQASGRKPLYSASQLFTKKKTSEFVPMTAAESLEPIPKRPNFFVKSIGAATSSFSPLPDVSPPVFSSGRKTDSDSHLGEDEEDLEIPAFIRKKVGL